MTLDEMVEERLAGWYATGQTRVGEWQATGREAHPWIAEQLRADIEKFNASHFGTFINPDTGKPEKFTEQHAREWVAAKRKTTDANLDADIAEMKRLRDHNVDGGFGKAYERQEAKIKEDYRQQNEQTDILRQILAQLGPNTPPIEVTPKGFIGPPPPTPQNGGATGLPFTPIDG